MRIQNLQLTDYGPLKNLTIPKFDDFMLFFGENESGKTLLLDAILRFLIRNVRERQLFGNLNRVKYDPTGYLVVASGGNEFRFPNDGSLIEILNINAEDLRNIFTVRASDIQLYEGKDKEYFSGITDRILGIHKELILKVCEEIRAQGKLTNTGKLSNAQDCDLIGSRIENAKALLSDLDSFVETNELDVSSMETELVQCDENIAILERDLIMLKDAGKRDRYKSGIKVLSDLEECLDNIEKLVCADQSIYDDWRDLENRLSISKNQLSKEENEIKERRINLVKIQDQYNKLSDEFDELNAKKTTINDLEKSTSNYKDKIIKIEGWQPIFQVFPYSAIISTILFGVSLFGLIQQINDGLFNISVIISGALSILFGSLLFIYKLVEGKKKRELKAFILLAKTVGIQASDFGDLLSGITCFITNLELTNKKVNYITAELKATQSNVDDYTKRIEDLRKQIERIANSLNEIKEKLGLSEIASLKSQIEENIKLEKEKTKLTSMLIERFDEPEGDIEDKLSIWKEEILELQPYENAFPEICYDKNKENDINNELHNLEGNRTNLNNNLENFRKEISKFGERVNSILSPNYLYQSDTLEDINFIRIELSKFIEEIEKKANYARMALEIFDEIQVTEEEKVKVLFKKGDLASSFFSNITNGKYIEITYEPSSGELFVLNKKGEKESAYLLSSGTFDQLYLATRLSLADLILKGEPGFLILDDPFLTSDSKRLSNQLKILLDLAKSGWQIIYISVKNEIKEGLQKAIKDKSVTLMELAPL